MVNKINVKEAMDLMHDSKSLSESAYILGSFLMIVFGEPSNSTQNKEPTTVISAHSYRYTD